MKYMNYFFAVSIGMMLKTLLPQYQAAASVPDAEPSYVFDTVSNRIEIAQNATLITPDYYSPEEKALEMWSFWYNESDNQLNKMLTEARKLKGASVRAILARDSTEEIPWMRVVYDDCTSGQCITRNFGHLEPKFRQGSWYIKTVSYPDAFKRIMENRIWVLKARDDIPYNIREFVQEFYPLALEHERRYGIPWQIKLAQAGLESSWGKSKLAREANQYFGIKKPSWYEGPTKSAGDEGGALFKFVAHTDAAESFEFHSMFLKRVSLYQDLYKYKPDSTYNYVFRVKAKNYWNTKQYKPVYHDINGKKTRLLDGKTYRLTGLECAMIELSRSGYASDYNYSRALLATVNLFSEPTN